MTATKSALTDPSEPASGSPSLLQRYETAVAKVAGGCTAENLLDALLLRDSIELGVSSSALEERRYVDRILAADTALRSLPRREFRRLRRSFIGWRQSLTPSSDAWWWSLDRTLPPSWQHAEFLLLLVSVALFPFSLGAGGELARLYSAERGGFFSLLPIAATFLGSFSIGGVLSLSFRDRWTSILELAGLGPRSRVVATSLVFMLLAAIVGLWFARPMLSHYFNDAGVSALAERPARQLSVAQLNLERAVRFDPTNRIAHYNLGRVYEDLLDDDHALAEDLIAFAAGLDLAGNNAAHIYLLRKQYDRAAFVLQRTFVLANADRADPELRYAIKKNFGWARFGQSRFPEARAALIEAATLMPERADAHCLLAKTLQSMGDSDAGNEWRSCLGLTWHDANELARDQWLGEAKAALRGQP